MQNEPLSASVDVLLTIYFQRELTQLAKKYRRIKSDVQPLLEQLLQGQTPGDQIPGVAVETFKVRARNSDAKRGKSGGYRIIYQRVSAKRIVVLTIYAKTEREDISPQQIRSIVEALHNEASEDENAQDTSSVADATAEQAQGEEQA